MLVSWLASQFVPFCKVRKSGIFGSFVMSSKIVLNLCWKMSSSTKVFSQVFFISVTVG